MIHLYGASASPFVRKVMAVLALKNLPYEHTQIIPFSRDEQLKKLNPLEKIPVLVDGDLTIGDSKVICRYLEDTHPEIPVYPQNSTDRARADWYEELGGAELAEYAAGIFFQRFMRPMVLKQETDEELVEKLITKKLPPLFDYIESLVPDDGFLFGDFGVADMALVSPLVNAGYAGYTLDAEKWPKYAAFADRVRAHSVVAPLLEAEAAMFGG